jgi:phage-related protein
VAIEEAAVGPSHPEMARFLERLGTAQRGDVLSMPESRPMPSIGPRCHELRVADVEQKREWRVMYYVGRHAIAILDVLQKSTRATPAHVIAGCRRRVTEFRKVDES